jgi:hypothetical protein
MERQAIMGTYVLHEHTFSCQAGNYSFEEKGFPVPSDLFLDRLVDIAKDLIDGLSEFAHRWNEWLALERRRNAAASER